MSITSSLFSELSSRGFNRLDGRIADLQTQAASGKNDPRLSADPVRGMRLSAAQEQREILDRFTQNIDHIGSRLSQADATMAEAVNMVRRVQEITLRAANDTLAPTDRLALVAELRELRDGLKDLGNARDSTGQPLFGGFKISGNPFEVQNGQVVYTGDTGRHSLRVSETATLPSGVDGASAFLSVQTEAGPKSVFEIIDDAIFAASPANERVRSGFAADREITVDFLGARTAEAVSMTVQGPYGAARVQADLVDGVPGPMIAAINAQAAETGVTASLAEDGRSIVLRGDGEIGLTGLEAGDSRRAVAQVTSPADPGTRYELIPARFSADAVLGKAGAALDHFADVRAEIGAMGQVADHHKATIAARSVEIDKAIAGLEDVDIARLVTQLQSLLLTRDAAQQTFVKITQSNLFDYLR